MWILIYYIVLGASANNNGNAVATGQVEFTNQTKCEQAAASLQYNKTGFGTRISVMCVEK